MLPAFFPWFLQNLIWIPTQILLRFFGHFKVYGIENLRGVKGGVIFVDNHISELDPILLPAAMPWFSRFLPMFYVSREKTFYNIRQILKRIFYGGFFFELWGAYQTHVGLRNYEMSLQTHIKILKSGHSLNISPEGDKSFDGAIHEFKGGAAFLSHRTGAPIVPVAITGSFKTTSGDFLARKKHFTLTFGKPIYPNELFAGLPVRERTQTGKTDIQFHDYKIAMNEVVRPRIESLLS